MNLPLGRMFSETQEFAKYTMQRWIRAAVFTAALSVALSAGARPKLDVLSERLRVSSDFRVRVQAALELGKTRDEQALPALAAALDDRDASVRAAAAAALGKLGVARGMRPLKEHLADPSESVRSAVKSALTQLTPKAEPSAAPEAQRILVKLGAVHNGTRVKSRAIEREILAESRRKLAEMPGVDVLPSEAAVASSAALASTAAVASTAAPAEEAPVVMITASIQKLAASRDGDSIVYSASIEYILHAMPDEAIMARISGSASAAATDQEAADKVATAVLRREVLAAAIQSALSRAPRALLAAARL